MLVYKAHGVPLVIATDDAGVWRSTMSNEYRMFCDRYKPTYAELKTLVYNSIRFSFLSNSDTQEQLKN
jgi:adenosine deaminase